MDIIFRACKHLHRTALSSEAISYKYGDLLQMAQWLSQDITRTRTAHGKSISPGSRIGILYPAGVEYVVSTWAIWMMGGIAVPLSPSHSSKEIAHVVRDSDASLVLSTNSLQDRLTEVVSESRAGVRNLQSREMSQGSLDEVPKERLQDEALLIYTSGTTGAPKGVLHTHKSLCAQIMGMTDAWEWSAEDSILHALPLHHIHGIVNALHTAHSNGACVDMLTHFSPKQVWKHFQVESPSVFMGVPTMYSRLISHYESMSIDEQCCARQAAERMRLFVCGSSACPDIILRKWEHITSHRLLERYGTTETGMVLSNPLKGERIIGTVGLPLPGVKVKTMGPSNEENMLELCVKSDSLFREYWRKPVETRAAFDDNGWYRTGDIASVDAESQHYRILGRRNVDIIKFGGFRLSALEIEKAIMECPHVQDCSVFGIPDEVYGEKVAAIVVYKDQSDQFDEVYLQKFCQAYLAKYKIPTEIWLAGSIPKNNMGKVNKKELLKAFFVRRCNQNESLKPVGEH